MPVDLLPGESKQLDAQLVPIAGPGQIALDRFFVANIGWWAAEKADLELQCWVRNVGAAPASCHLNMVGEIMIAKQLPRIIDEHKDFVVQPGALYKYIWVWHSYPGDPAWVRVHINDQPIMPRFDWTVGYALLDPSIDSELRAAYVGPDWVNLRYAQTSDCRKWTVMAWTPPTGTIEHQKQYPRLSISGSWTSLYHLVTPLLPGRNYRGYVLGEGYDAYRDFRTL